MTDKQIIIDGVNITGCTWCDFEPDAEPYCRINDGEDLACEDNPNCYFKQLARKTQECEKLLKENQQLRNSLSDSLMFKFTGQENETNRYRKALEEIEEYIKEEEWSLLDYVIRDINDIINKAKGEE